MIILRWSSFTCYLLSPIFNEVFNFFSLIYVFRGY